MTYEVYEVTKQGTRERLLGTADNQAEAETLAKTELGKIIADDNEFDAKHDVIAVKRVDNLGRAEIIYMV